MFLLNKEAWKNSSIVYRSIQKYECTSDVSGIKFSFDYFIVLQMKQLRQDLCNGKHYDIIVQN